MTIEALSTQLTPSTLHRPALIVRSRDSRDPLLRLSRLLDPGSIQPLHPHDPCAVMAVRGRIGGQPVTAFCTDGRKMGGALGHAECVRIVDAIDEALVSDCPVVGIWHSGGAKLADGVHALHGIGSVFRATVAASGKVPQLSVVVGPAAGGAAYGPALTDLVLLADGGQLFVTGPNIIRSVTGEEVSMEELGGSGAHGRKSGVAHIAGHSEQETYRRAARLVDLLGRPGRPDPLAIMDSRDPSRFLPESARRTYDVRPLIADLLDEHPSGRPLEELQPDWAPNVVIGLGRIGGGTVGVLANNPIQRVGCLDALSADKASRFVRMCDALGIPLLVLVDVPGYLPGVDEEWGGVLRRGSKLLYAFAEAVVPRVAVITRKAYGGAYIAMNSRSLGASTVFNWPDAEVAVMGAESAVELLHRRQLAGATEEERPALRARLIAAHLAATDGVAAGLGLGAIDRTIEPRLTRLAVAAAFAEAKPARGQHGNIPL